MSDEEFMKSLEGLEVEEARKRVEQNRKQFQIVSRDGFRFPGTGEFRRNRIGVHVTKGKVTGAELG
jgi:hypothetical protein